MQPIITQPGRGAHPDPDQAARQRAGRLARATPAQVEKALAYLSMIDPEAFEIALTAVTPAGDQDTADEDTADEDTGEEPIPVCRRCGAMVAIFPDRGLRWRHFRGSASTSGTQQVYDPGHAAQVTWILPGEGPDEL